MVLMTQITVIREQSGMIVGQFMLVDTRRRNFNYFMVVKISVKNTRGSKNKTGGDQFVNKEKCFGENVCLVSKFRDLDH